MSERSQLVSRLDNLNGKLELLNEQLDDIDEAAAEEEAALILETPDGKKAALLDQASVKTVSKEREFTENALKAAIKRQSDLEEKLAQLGKLNRDPAESASILNALDQRIEELTLRHDACEMAREALLAAGENLRSGIIPKIAEKASVFVEKSTCGEHDRITLDNSFNPGVANGSDILPSEILSRGTADLSYIALRLSLFGEIFSEEKPTVILDESFAHIDRDRIRGILSSLDDGQYIVFTCRSDEADVAAEIGHNVIKM